MSASDARQTGAALPTTTDMSMDTGTGSLRNRLRTRPPQFEEDLQKVQKRLTSEGADVGAVERLRGIFLDGKVTIAALKTDTTLDQRRRHEGRQKYMLLLKAEAHPHSSHKVHRCMLCPPWARLEYRNPKDSLRHFRRDHFGLSSVCSHW